MYSTILREAAQAGTDWLVMGVIAVFVVIGILGWLVGRNGWLPEDKSGREEALEDHAEGHQQGEI